MRGSDIWAKICSCRYWDIIDHTKILREYAVGWAPSESLWVRPKDDEIAVMFLIDDEFCWAHFRKDEFEYVFR